MIQKIQTSYIYRQSCVLPEMFMCPFETIIYSTIYMYTEHNDWIFENLYRAHLVI